MRQFSRIRARVEVPLMPSLCSSAPVLKPGIGLLDDEGAELAAVHLGEDDEDIGEAGVGDPHLGAVQHPVVAVQHGGGLGAQGVAARCRPR